MNLKNKSVWRRGTGSKEYGELVARNETGRNIVNKTVQMKRHRLYLEELGRIDDIIKTSLQLKVQDVAV